MERKKYEPLFPERFDYLNAKYETFQSTLAAIDYQLTNGLQDRGPNPALTPNGMRITDPELRRRRNEFLERTREKGVKTFKASYQKDIAAMAENQRSLIDGRFDFETSRNEFKNYSKDDLNKERDIEKSSETSFDYMVANYFNKYELPEKSIADEKENIERWTDRYLDMINDWHEHQNSNLNLELDDHEPELD